MAGHPSPLRRTRIPRKPGLPVRDILAITVNRWPHGYAPESNALWEPDLPLEARLHVVGHRRFGHIAIADADVGRSAYTVGATGPAHRVAGKLLALPG